MAAILVIDCLPRYAAVAHGKTLKIAQRYRALAKQHSVTILTDGEYDAQFEEIEHCATLRELRFPKDQSWRNAHAALKQLGISGDINGLAFSLAAANQAYGLRQAANELAQAADIVIHETPYSEPLFNAGCPAREIYYSCRIETMHLSAAISGAGATQGLLQLLRLEQSLVDRVQRIYAATYEDLQIFHLLYGASYEKLSIGLHSGGGVVQASSAPRPGTKGPGQPLRARLVFFGTNGPADREAARFLVGLAGVFADCDMILAGSVCESLNEMNLPGNIILIDFLPPMKRHELLSQADVYLNPAATSSEHWLNTIDALAAGVAMVSSEAGVEGLGLIPGLHYEPAQRSGFAAAIRKLLSESGDRKRLAASAAEAAHGKFLSDHLAAVFAKSLFTDAPALECPRPLLLALNDYPVLTDDSGGKVRIRSLLGHTDFNIVLLAFGNSFKIQMISSHVLHLVVPKTKAHRDFEQALNHGQAASANDMAACLYADANALLAALVSQLARRASATIFEHPYMAPLLDAIHAVSPGLPVIYSAHNVEAKLKATMLQGHAAETALVQFTAALERKLAEQAALIICCTAQDAAEFKYSKARIVVIQNGCSIPHETAPCNTGVPPARRPIKRVGFLGSNHGPNADAARFILTALVPEFPELTFEFAGSVCETLPMPATKEVVYHRIIDEEKKTVVLRGWDVALNPVASGGGSNLKLSDYFAHGLATISTSVGARGFSVLESHAGLVVEQKDFSATLRALLANPAAACSLRKNARRYAVAALDWPLITKDYNASLHALLGTRSSGA